MRYSSLCIGLLSKFCLGAPFKNTVFLFFQFSNPHQKTFQANIFLALSACYRAHEPATDLQDHDALF